MRLIDADEFIKKFRYAEANTEDEKNYVCYGKKNDQRTADSL